MGYWIISLLLLLGALAPTEFSHLTVLGPPLRALVGKYNSMMVKPCPELERELTRNATHLKSFFAALRKMMMDSVFVKVSLHDVPPPLTTPTDIVVPTDSLVMLEVPRTMQLKRDQDDLTLFKFFSSKPSRSFEIIERSSFHINIDDTWLFYRFKAHYYDDVTGRPSPWYKCGDSVSLHETPYSSCWIYSSYKVFNKKPRECCMNEIQDYVCSWLSQCERLRHQIPLVKNQSMEMLVNYSVSVSEDVKSMPLRRTREEVMILRLPSDANLTLYCEGSRLLEYQVNETRTSSFSMTFKHRINLSHPPGVIDLPWIQVNVVVEDDDCQLWPYRPNELFDVVTDCKSIFTTNVTDCVEHEYDCALRRNRYSCLGMISVL